MEKDAGDGRTSAAQSALVRPHAPQHSNQPRPSFSKQLFNATTKYIPNSDTHARAHRPPPLIISTIRVHAPLPSTAHVLTPRPAHARSMQRWTAWCNWFFVLLLFAAAAAILATPLRYSARFAKVFPNQAAEVVLRPFAAWKSNTSVASGSFGSKMATSSNAGNGGSSTRPLTTSTHAAQKLRQPPQPPPLFTATPQSLLADTDRIIARSKALEDRLVGEVKPSDATFDNVVVPAVNDENEAALETHLVGFYQSVSTDQKLRDASSEADERLDKYSIEASMREDVFKLIDGVFQRNETLDPESRRLVEKERKGYIRNGLSLPVGPKRDRFKQIQLRLAELSNKFSKTLNEEKGGIWFTPDELEGMPEDVLSTLEKGSGINESKLRLTFKYPHLFPLLKYVENPKVRQKVFLENDNKCNSNVPLFKETVVLRDEAARLLGYPNHATFRIEEKMAKTPAYVDDFLGGLRKKLTPLAKKEMEVLRKLKQDELSAKGQPDDGHYWAWDHRFYSRIQLERDYQLDQQKLSEWFPLSTTLGGMLKIFEQLLGLQFVEIVGEDRAALSPTGKGDDIVWHDEVQLFSVWNDQTEGDGFVGYLYTDLHPREGKYGHAANFNLQPGFLQANGSRRYPATALVCNFSKASAKRPSLLKHDEVVTMFHELGHGIHDLVGKTKYARFHGTSVVQDFVEAPSQMLENWCWTPSQLKALSHHYSYLSPSYKSAWEEAARNASGTATTLTQPPERIPNDLITSLIKTKHVNDALANLRQLQFGIFDMTVHEPASHTAIEAMDTSATFNRLRSEIVPIDGPEQLGLGDDWGHGEATFGHLVGGYDAGYYGYLSSQVYSADMFASVFKIDPMNGVEGRRYRQVILEKGGSRPEMDILKEFLGREPNSDAFYKELGLA